MCDEACAYVCVLYCAVVGVWGVGCGASMMWGDSHVTLDPGLCLLQSYACYSHVSATAM